MNHRLKQALDEIPSVAMLTGCYLLFYWTTVNTHEIGYIFAFCALVPTLVLHSSLQHEFIHGHPTQYQFINDLLVALPIGLFVPYLRFKDTHLAHHFDPNLTDPYDDPESNYLDPKLWHAQPRWLQGIGNFNNILFGRMLIGPALGLFAFYRKDLTEIRKLNRRIILSYLHHGLGLTLVAIWFVQFANMPFWMMFLAAYIGMSILKIRTYLEHKAHERASARSVIIEDKGPLAFLFLNNNYHSIHHSHPKLVWHRLPAKYNARKLAYLTRNGHYQFQSYWSVFKAYLFKRKDPVPHPLMPQPIYGCATASEIEGHKLSARLDEKEPQ